MSVPTTVSWRVRGAEQEDVAAIASGVWKLLEEIGAAPPSSQALQEATRALLEEPAAGVVLITEADGALIGLLAASWLSAIHIPGRYGLIQDLWVEPAWRNRAVGAGLLAALLERTRECGLSRVEVGLPRESFPALSNTEAFYRANGFEPLGSRMRLRLT